MLRTTVSRALKEALLTSEAIQTKGSKYFYSLVYLITWQNRRYCYYSRGCHTIFSTRILEKKMAFLLHKTKPVYTKEDIMLRTTVSRLLRRPILSDRGRKDIASPTGRRRKRWVCIGFFPKRYLKRGLGNWIRSARTCLSGRRRRLPCVVLRRWSYLVVTNTPLESFPIHFNELFFILFRARKRERVTTSATKTTTRWRRALHFWGGWRRQKRPTPSRPRGIVVHVFSMRTPIAGTTVNEVKEDDEHSRRLCRRILRRRRLRLLLRLNRCEF